MRPAEPRWEEAGRLAEQQVVRGGTKSQQAELQRGSMPLQSKHKRPCWVGLLTERAVTAPPGFTHDLKVLTPYAIKRSSRTDERPVRPCHSPTAEPERERDTVRVRCAPTRTSLSAPVKFANTTLAVGEWQGRSLENGAFQPLVLQMCHLDSRNEPGRVCGISNDLHF